MRFPVGTRVRRKDDAPHSRVGEEGTVIGIVWVQWDHSKNDGEYARTADLELIPNEKDNV